MQHPSFNNASSHQLCSVLSFWVRFVGRQVLNDLHNRRHTKTLHDLFNCAKVSTLLRVGVIIQQYWSCLLWLYGNFKFPSKWSWMTIQGNRTQDRLVFSVPGIKFVPLACFLGGFQHASPSSHLAFSQAFLVRAFPSFQHSFRCSSYSLAPPQRLQHGSIILGSGNRIISYRYLIGEPKLSIPFTASNPEVESCCWDS